MTDLAIATGRKFVPKEFAWYYDMLARKFKSDNDIISDLGAKFSNWIGSKRMSPTSYGGYRGGIGGTGYSPFPKTPRYRSPAKNTGKTYQQMAYEDDYHGPQRYFGVPRLSGSSSGAKCAKLKTFRRKKGKGRRR